MSNFPEPSTPGFVPVYQLKRTDAVDAGSAGDGPSNLPLKNLVERTAYLKKEVDDLDTALGGVVIGSTVQAYDDDLAAIAALTTTGIIDRTGAGTAATRATGATGLAVLAAADAATARTAIGAMANTAPEIITNANGTAYRWPNGLQICTRDSIDYINQTSLEFGRIIPNMYHYSFSITPPASFVSASSFAYGIDSLHPGICLTGTATGIIYMSRAGTTLPSANLSRIVWIGRYL